MSYHRPTTRRAILAAIAAGVPTGQVAAAGFLANLADGSSMPFPRATWHFYASQSLAPRSVYGDPDLRRSLGNMVEADSAGRFPAIYLDASVKYRGLLRNAAGAVIHDLDPVGVGPLSVLAEPDGAKLIGSQRSDKGAARRSIYAKAEDLRFIEDLGAIGSSDAEGAPDSARAFQRAAEIGGTWYLRNAGYKVGTKIVPTAPVIFQGSTPLATCRIHSEADDFMFETKEALRVSTFRNVQLTGDLSKPHSAGLSLYDNGDLPIENLQIHSFSRQGIRIECGVNVILRAIRAYNCGVCIELDGGSDFITNPKLENVYLGHSRIGIKTNKTVSLNGNHVIIERCLEPIKASVTSGEINHLFLEDNKNQPRLASSNIRFLNSTNTVGSVLPDSSWNVSDFFYQRFQEISDAACGGALRTTRLDGLNPATWTDVAFDKRLPLNYYVSPQFVDDSTASPELQFVTTGWKIASFDVSATEAGARRAGACAVRLLNHGAEVLGSYRHTRIAAGDSIQLSGSAVVYGIAGQSLKLQFQGSTSSVGLSHSEMGLAAPVTSVSASLFVRSLGIIN